MMPGNLSRRGAAISRSLGRRSPLVAAWLLVALACPATRGLAQETEIAPWGSGDAGERRVVPDIPLDRRPQEIVIPWSWLTITGIALVALAGAVIAIVVADRVADRRHSREPGSIIPRRPP